MTQSNDTSLTNDDIKPVGAQVTNQNEMMLNNISNPLGTLIPDTKISDVKSEEKHSPIMNSPQNQMPQNPMLQYQMVGYPQYFSPPPPPVLFFDMNQLYKIIGEAVTIQIKSELSAINNEISNLKNISKPQELIQNSLNVSTMAIDAQPSNDSDNKVSEVSEDDETMKKAYAKAYGCSLGIVWILMSLQNQFLVCRKKRNKNRRCNESAY